MRDAKGGRCANCGKAVDVLCLDHSHTSGKVRGLLCAKCNVGVGPSAGSTTLLLRGSSTGWVRCQLCRWLPVRRHFVVSLPSMRSLFHRRHGASAGISWKARLATRSRKSCGCSFAGRSGRKRWRPWIVIGFVNVISHSHFVVNGTRLGRRKTGTCGEIKLTSSAIMPVRISGSPNFGFRAAIVFSAVLALLTPALAEIQIRGNPEALTIEAHDTSVEEVLAALSRTFGIDYDSSIDLSKRLHGTYIGPLSRVVTRILEGYSFVLKTDNGSLVITVVGGPNVPASASPALGAPRAAGPQPGQPAPAPIPRTRSGESVAVELNAGRRK
jgi:hypothetical protein